MLFERNKEKYLELYILFCELTNADFLIRPVNDIIINDIICFATFRSTNIFVQPDESMGWLCNKIRNNQQLLTDVEIERVCEDSKNEKEHFVNKVLMVFDDTSLEEAKTKLEKEKSEGSDTILNCWRVGGTAEAIATSFAESLGVKDKCCEKGIGKLLEIPSIRIFIGYIINSWYRQVDVGAVEKPSSAYDFRHAICAGVTGNIVTHDKKLRQAIENIPGHDIEVFSLDELLLI